MQNFKTLKVWEKSHELTLAVYKATANFPKDELYGLTSQIRRACASIPANIAEGCGKFTNKDLGNFLQIALGSANEVEYLILFSYELGFFNKTLFETFTKEIGEIKGMLISLIKKVRS